MNVAAWGWSADSSAWLEGTARSPVTPYCSLSLVPQRNYCLISPLLLCCLSLHSALFPSSPAGRGDVSFAGSCGRRELCTGSGVVEEPGWRAGRGPTELRARQGAAGTGQCTGGFTCSWAVQGGVVQLGWQCPCSGTSLWGPHGSCSHSPHPVSGLGGSVEMGKWVVGLLLQSQDNKVCRLLPCRHTRGMTPPPGPVR